MACPILLSAQIAGLDAKIDRVEKQPSAEVRQDEVARRFMTVPGTGPITAMGFQASHHGWKASSAGVTFSAWLRLRASTRPGAGQDGGAQADDAGSGGAANPMPSILWALTTKEERVTGFPPLLDEGDRRQAVGIQAGPRTGMGGRSTRRDRANRHQHVVRFAASAVARAEDPLRAYPVPLGNAGLPALGPVRPFHLRVELQRLRHGGRQRFGLPAASAAVHLHVAGAGFASSSLPVTPFMFTMLPAMTATSTPLSGEDACGGDVGQRVGDGDHGATD